MKLSRELIGDDLLQFYNSRNKFWFRSFSERDEHTVILYEQTK